MAPQWAAAVIAQLVNSAAETLSANRQIADQHQRENHQRDQRSGDGNHDARTDLPHRRGRRPTVRAPPLRRSSASRQRASRCPRSRRE